jgi:hypothetical protein
MLLNEPLVGPTKGFRAVYRVRVLPKGYSGPLHIAVVLCLGLGAIALAVGIAVPSFRWIDLSIVPVTVVLGNVVEYLAHRGPMHMRWPPLEALYERHTKRHHRYFTARAMYFESSRDFHAVLFPPLLLMFFGGIAALLGLAAALVLPTAAAALFFASAVGYYLIYEVLHFLYHVPPWWSLSRVPGVAWLAQLHRLHHDPQVMRHSNFNLVFPLCDWAFDTLDTGHSAFASTVQDVN